MNKKVQVDRAAEAHAEALEGWHRRCNVLERDGLTVLIEQEPELVSDRHGNLIGVGYWVRAFRRGKEVPVDPHRMFYNPGRGFEEAVFRSVFENPHAAGWRTKGTVSTFNGTLTGFIFSQNADYNTARAGSGLTVAGTAGGGFSVAHALYSGPSYDCEEGFVSFDTSPLGSSTMWTAAPQLKLYTESDTTVTGQVLEARLKLYGSSLTTADWVAGASLGSLLLLANINTSSLSNGTYTTWSAQPDFYTNINFTDLTQILLNWGNMRTGGAPSVSTNYVSFSGHTDANVPQLVLTHEVMQLERMRLTLASMRDFTSFPVSAALEAMRATGRAPAPGIPGLENLERMRADARFPIVQDPNIVRQLEMLTASARMMDTSPNQLQSAIGKRHKLPWGT